MRLSGARGGGGLGLKTENPAVGARFSQTTCRAPRIWVVGTWLGWVMDLRLDSCADVTLISETLYESLKFKPKLRQGMCMKLYGLTESSAKMKGYVLLPIFMTGIVIETQAEA
jgi:hypothetical protein